MATTDITEKDVPEKQITIPATREYPSVKYNPLYYIKDTDVVEVVILLNGVEQKHYKYTPSLPLAPGEGRLFEAKLSIVKTIIPEEV